MTGMCLKKGNSKSHRERFNLLTWAISVTKNEEKLNSFNIQISFCTRSSLSTSLVRTAFSPGLKVPESRRKVTGHCHLHCEVEVSGKVPSSMNWRGTESNILHSSMKSH